MNSVVTIPCRTIRQLAWQMGKSSYWECVFIALCCSIIEGALSFIVGSFTSNAFILSVVNIIEYAISVIVNIGLANMFIKVFRGQKANVDMITEVFPLTVKGIVVDILSTLKIVLKMFLLIVPGFIEAIRNCMIYQVLADDPDIAPDECIERSHQIMEGNKWKYVKLCLSFLGWSLLAGVPANIYTYYAYPALSSVTIDMTFADTFKNQWAMMDQINSDPIYIVLRALTILVQVYLLMSVACFYDLASGNLVIQDTEEF